MVKVKEVERGGVERKLLVGMCRIWIKPHRKRYKMQFELLFYFPVNLKTI